MIKLLNLNIWNYNNFTERKPKIISFIKKHNPDIVSFQEIQDDARYNKKGDNQAEQLNRELHYPHLRFFPVDKMKKNGNEWTEGVAVLSKFPVVKIEKKRLHREADDKHNRGILYVKLKAKKTIELLVVHFSNNDLFSLLNLIETMDYCKRKRIKPIIVGDFNIRHADWLHDFTQEYKSSLQYKKYLSYPLAKYTLDYILLPKKYAFKSLQCTGKGLSDHKALVAEIQ